MLLSLLLCYYYYYIILLKLVSQQLLFSKKKFSFYCSSSCFYIHNLFCSSFCFNLWWQKNHMEQNMYRKYLELAEANSKLFVWRNSKRNDCSWKVILKVHTDFTTYSMVLLFLVPLSARCECDTCKNDTIIAWSQCQQSYPKQKIN